MTPDQKHLRRMFQSANTPAHYVRPGQCGFYVRPDGSFIADRGVELTHRNIMGDTVNGMRQSRQERLYAVYAAAMCRRYAARLP